MPRTYPPPRQSTGSKGSQTIFILNENGVIISPVSINDLKALVVIAEKVNMPVPALTTVEAIPESSIESYKFKTVSIKCDYALVVRIYAYDDPSEFDEDDPYLEDTLTSNRSSHYSFEEDFKYIRIRVENQDSVAHNIIYCRVKGRVI